MTVLTWRRIKRKVSRIRTFYINQLVEVGLKMHLRTLGHRFTARRITLENGLKVLTYEEENTTNYIRVT